MHLWMRKALFLRRTKSSKWEAGRPQQFLSKSAEKSLPFFKTLKKCTKKSDFQWTAEAETSFKQMKKLIAELPMLAAPKENEELIIYLAAVKEAISAVLMTERDEKQISIYFVSRALQGPEINYTPMEKLILALILSNPEVTGRLLKWSFELGEHDIHNRPRTSVNGQILADFIVERPEDDPPYTPMEEKREQKSRHVKQDGIHQFCPPEQTSIIEELKEKSIDEKKVLAVAEEEEGRTWMTLIHEYLTEEIFLEKRKARAIRRKAAVPKTSGSWDELVVSVQCLSSNPSLPLFLLHHLTIGWGAGFCKLSTGKGYRGNGEVGNG
ncbi:reverse transcriptase domain-containing protein [Tanacetum coccineum]